MADSPPPISPPAIVLVVGGSPIPLSDARTRAQVRMEAWLAQHPEREVAELARFVGQLVYEECANVGLMLEASQQRESKNVSG